jgi:hypothetical protein
VAAWAWAIESVISPRGAGVTESVNGVGHLVAGPG